MNLFLSLATGFAATQQSLQPYGAERTIYWREASVGLSPAAYYAGKNIAFALDVFAQPLLFTILFYFIAMPRASFGLYYAVLLVNQFALTGLGMLISVLLDPKKSQLAAVVMTLVFNAASGFSPTMSELSHFSFVTWFSYARWLIEALFIMETDQYPDIFLQEKKFYADRFSYTLGDWGQFALCIVIISIIGLLARMATYLALVFVNRDKQK